MQQEATYMLTREDQLILDSYKDLAAMLSFLLGNTCECVLHSLEHLNESVIFIHNGELTGRSLGTCLPEPARNHLKKCYEDGRSFIGPFKSSGIYGQQLRSVCFIINNYSEPHHPIGILCLNLNMDVPLTELVQAICNFDPHQQPNPVPKELRDKHKNHQHNMSSEVKRYIDQAVASAQAEVLNSPWIKKRHRNGIIIHKLFSQGLFQVRNSVTEVANILNISKDAVYMHIRHIRELNKTKEDKRLAQRHYTAVEKNTDQDER